MAFCNFSRQMAGGAEDNKGQYQMSLRAMPCSGFQVGALGLRNQLLC